MRISVGIDIAKEVHWVCALDAEGRVLLDRRLENEPAATAGLIEELTNWPTYYPSSLDADDIVREMLAH